MLKKYMVDVRGENFHLTDFPNRMAFATFRFVEAADEAEAGRAAFIAVRNDATFADRVHFEPGDAPRVFIERAQEIEEFPQNIQPLTGIIFYDDDSPT